MTNIDQIEKSHLSDRAEGDLAAYQAICPAALLGLVLGVGAAAAFGHPIAWLVPIAGVIVNLWALRTIDRHPAEYVGRKLAVCGLALSLVFGGAAPARYLAQLEGSRMMARRVAQTWFQRLRAQQFPQVLEMTRQPRLRLPPDEVDSYYRDELDGQRAMRAFSTDPVVQAVRVLGPDAQLRYVSTEMQTSSQNTEWIKMRFDVYENESASTPLFKVRMSIERSAKGTQHEHDWQLKRVEFVEAIPAGVNVVPR